jgi:hypothetical protein
MAAITGHNIFYELGFGVKFGSIFCGGYHATHFACSSS